MSRWIAAAIAACMLLSTAPALAAASGIVRGVVTQSGTPKAGATVTLTGQGQLYTAKTNAQGAYSFPTVTFGRYLLTVHVDGATDKTQDVDVVEGAVSVVNLDVLKTIVVTSTNAMAGVSGSPVATTTMDQRAACSFTRQQQSQSPDRDRSRRGVILVQRTRHQRLPRRDLRGRRCAASARNDVELRGNYRSQNDRLTRDLHRSDSG